MNTARCSKCRRYLPSSDYDTAPNGVQRKCCRACMVCIDSVLSNLLLMFLQLQRRQRAGDIRQNRSIVHIATNTCLLSNIWLASYISLTQRIQLMLMILSPERITLRLNISIALIHQVFLHQNYIYGSEHLLFC